MQTKRVAGLSLFLVSIMLIVLQVSLASATPTPPETINVPLPDSEEDVMGYIIIDPVNNNPAGIVQDSPPDPLDSNALEPELDQPAREKDSGNSPRVLLACLASLDRLRGHVSTRWFAPSDCPTENR